MGFLIIVYEWTWEMRLYTRFYSYISLSIFPLFNLITIYASVSFLITAGLYWRAIHYNEFDFNSRKYGKKAGYCTSISCISWFQNAVKQSKWQKYMFALLWISFNIVVYI